VDDAKFGGALECRSNLAHDAKRQQGLRRAFLHDEFAQIAALDVFEGHVVQPLCLADDVHLDDVGVRGPGDVLGLELPVLGADLLEQDWTAAVAMDQTEEATVAITSSR